MYSRSSWEKKGYTVPPGYDGSRFRRNSRHGGDVILVPDSGFTDHGSDDDTLSVGGIPTSRGISRRRSSTYAENDAPLTEAVADYDAVSFVDDTPDDDPVPDEPHSEAKDERTESDDKLSGILERLGFGGKLSSDELILCALIFIIASDENDDGRGVGDILLILALLLGLR